MIERVDRTAARQPSAAGSSHRVRWLAALLGLATFALFANCLRNSFVWDDEQFIVKNSFLTSPKLLPQLLTHNVVAGAGLDSNLYRPVASMTHLLDVQLWGYRPFWHHLVTVLIHVAAAVAIFWMLSRLFGAWPAWLATAWYA